MWTYGNQYLFRNHLSLFGDNLSLLFLVLEKIASQIRLEQSSEINSQLLETFSSITPRYQFKQTHLSLRVDLW